MDIKTNDKYNYGLGALKIFMCFEVVLCHYWSTNDIQIYLMPFSLLCITAVPTFMIMSFYFCKDVFISQSFLKNRDRLVRLTYPYIVWGILYFLFYALIKFVGGHE